MAKKSQKDLIPSVLAFEKKLVCSDGYFYGTQWAKRADPDAITPLVVTEKSVRGTISNRLPAKLQNSPEKIDQEVEKANLQTVDTCSLNVDQDTLKHIFTLKVLSGIETPTACNNEAFLTAYQDVAKNYAKHHQFKELAHRYATNIANARFLWRNRIGAQQIEVIVTIGEKRWVFNAYDFPLANFDKNNDQLTELSTLIAQTLSGERTHLMIEIETNAQVGLAQEVYPSEELVFDKGKGEKSKILYSVNMIAAMHSQKIGNALRTIDTWYSEYHQLHQPIAIETYGSVTTLGKAYRKPSDKQDFYTLFDQYALGESLDATEQEHYVMAMLVRGGVFGSSSKE